MTESNQPGPGEEVRPQDAGVPNDPPGPDVPEESRGRETTDVPGHPTDDQPEGVAQEDADDESTDEEIAQVGDVEDSGDSADGDGPDDGDGPADIGAPTRPAEPAS